MTSLAYNVLKHPNELIPHQINTEIYGKELADQNLVESIQRNGILETLVIRPDNTILSGHRRWTAAKELRLTKVPCRVIHFDDPLDEEEALIEFNRQREKTFSQRMKESDYLEKIEREKAKARELAGKKIEPSANVGVRSEKGEVRDIVAAKVGMSHGTYDKARKVWAAAKTGDTHAKELIQKVDSGEKSVNAAYIDHRTHTKAQEPLPAPPAHEPESVSSLVDDGDDIPYGGIRFWTEDDFTAAAAEVDAEDGIDEDDEAAVNKTAHPDICNRSEQLFTSDTSEWYTPVHIVDKIIEFWGEIDLDPCSNAQGEEANIPAEIHLTKERDGLKRRWGGKVYMNPPYGREVVDWINKIQSEIASGYISEAIILIAARTDTQWFNSLVKSRYVWCAIEGRLSFTGPNAVKNSAPFPSALFYYGDRVQDFYHAFKCFGPICRALVDEEMMQYD